MARVVGGLVELVGEERHVGGSELIGKLLSDILLVGKELAGKVLSILVGKELVGISVGKELVGNSVGNWVENSAGKLVGNFLGKLVGSSVGSFVGKLVGSLVGKERVGKRAPQLQLDLSFRLLQSAISQYDLMHRQMTLLELEGGKFYKLSNLPGSHLTLPLHHLPGNWNYLFLLSPMSSCF